MEFRLLGPFEVSHGDARIDIRGGTMHAKILSILVLAEGRAVSMPRFIEALWDGAAPATADRQVRNRVAAVRRTLSRAGHDPIETVSGGYRLPIGNAEHDIRSFAAIRRAARAHASAGRYEAAITAIGDALRIWRGPALMGMMGRVFESAARGLEEARLSAMEARVEWWLRISRHEDVIAELTALVAEHPQRQRLVGYLMRALQACGRTAEALDVHQECRQRLAVDLGIEPDESLRRIQLSILRDHGNPER